MLFSLQPMQEERNQIQDNLELTRLWGILSKRIILGWVSLEFLRQVGQKGTDEPSFLDLFPSHKIQQENKNTGDQIN